MLREKPAWRNWSGGGGHASFLFCSLTEDVRQAAGKRHRRQVEVLLGSDSSLVCMKCDGSEIPKMSVIRLVTLRRRL